MLHYIYPDIQPCSFVSFFVVVKQEFLSMFPRILCLSEITLVCGFIHLLHHLAQADDLAVLLLCAFRWFPREILCHATAHG